MREYGSTEAGGLIRHITYPDDFMAQRDAYIASVATLADDPLLKAIVVNEAIPGTAEAFQRIKAKRPEIYCLAGEAQEEPSVISPAADMVANLDFISRGYLIPWAAKQMGAKTFVHISFPRHMSQEAFGRRAAIMREACDELGIRIAFEKAPDPTSDNGLAGAYTFYVMPVAEWISKYSPNGEKVAFFCTNNAHTELVLKRLFESKNGIFIEADDPSPLIGYPGALHLDLRPERGDSPAILKRVEDAIIAKGGAGHFGTWAYSYAYTTSAGLGEYAVRILQGKARKNSLKDLLAAYAKWTPGAGWNGAFYTDGEGRRFGNLALVYQDTYIFGGLKGQHYLRTTKVKVPRKYLTMPWARPAVP